MRFVFIYILRNCLIFN